MAASVNPPLTDRLPSYLDPVNPHRKQHRH